MIVTKEMIDSAVRVLSGNIAMFEKYVTECRTEHNQIMLDTYKEWLSSISKFQANELKYEDLPWQAQMYFYEAPTWFTKGT